MRKYIFIAAFVTSTSAMALDFDTEWAKFKNDFAKLASKTSIKVDMDVPIVGNVPVVDVQQVDPKAPERLGNTVSDPALKNKLQSLYKRPDVVVYSTTVR